MDFCAGDIAACYGTDLPSSVIRWGTLSVARPPRLGPSHVAILAPTRLTSSDHLQEDLPLHRSLWWESTTLCHHACLVSGKPVDGVQVHEPQRRIDDYVQDGGWVEVYRLTAINRLLPNEEDLLARTLAAFIGAPYDMAGAMISGTRLLQASRLCPGADLQSLFCSELVAAVLMRLNRLNHANPTRFNPARLLRELRSTGKYALAGTFR